VDDLEFSVVSLQEGLSFWIIKVHEVSEMNERSMQTHRSSND